MRRLCGLGCAGYVVAGLIENKAKLSPAKLGLRLSLAIDLKIAHGPPKG